MITLLVEESNPLTQNFYDNLINNLQFHQLKCSCGSSSCLSIHAYYDRSVKLPEGKMTFHICRVICKNCHRTHALLLSSMVPYSQISTSDQIFIIENFINDESQDSVMDNNPSIEENNYRYVIKNYLRHWCERLRSEQISLSPLNQLISSCFAHFSKQFMQIKRTSNTLFLCTT